MIIFWEQLQDRFIGRVDILLLTRERHPAERSLALAEQRADIGRHKAGELEGIADAVVISLLADIVAIIEDLRAGSLEIEHCMHVLRHRLHCHLFIPFRIGLAQFIRCRNR